MEFFLMITFIVCFAIILTYYAVLLYSFEKKRKELISNYEKLLILKDWYEKVSEEATRSLIIERVEKRGNELIDLLNLLNIKLVKIQERQAQLQEQQKNLHNNLLEEQRLLNEYFENYS